MRALGNASTRITAALGSNDIPSPTAAAAGIPLGGLERRVLEHVTGFATVADIVATTALSIVEVSHVLRRLVELGAVTVQSEHALDESWEEESKPSPVSSPAPTTVRAREE
jgi:hypothetical protein